MVHLTNYCMQIQGEQCGAHEQGNAVSFDDLGTDQPHVRFRECVLPQIYALIADAVLASRKELLHGLREHSNGRRVCHLLGYDFMITASGRPVLIECNANPLLAAQNEWHGLLVSRMVDDYVAIAADAAFFAHGDATPPLPRPPLDGAHVSNWGDGSGFELLIGKPTEAHHTARFGTHTVGGVVVLKRPAAELQKASAVDEPPPPESSVPPKIAEVHELRAKYKVRTGAMAATDRVRSDLAAAREDADKRRLAAARFAQAHRAAAAISVPAAAAPPPRAGMLASTSRSSLVVHGSVARRSSSPGQIGRARELARTQHVRAR